jgi:hypothetical protein
VKVSEPLVKCLPSLLMDGELTWSRA